ncbi:MAG TPA: thiamine pyrophosphate-binding protein [Ottowia sp.]|uniref:thiamine pyrophosphate-binding protein n=1 Tax=Ottowia sp. TaxID=1898956 RepID=UPI002B8026D7|nr:thiamine pyrophosphate-binding protein [Ottowia sp.]MCZ2088006.1 thiamine pyrophosphate-binding protein [Burkholderiales bacterium]HNE60005.1 thiamine pyrophosphate-binding protein [Ottowia sp.]HNI84966.1 thiamine pyrophosphate-binding protein [Ottowia sp.]HNL41234.1 thiamine pyrophosphate-binding protein [Ottowia sp.]HNN35005.1 thiamine pyrophosphate-binding protein [Ottowia sp.]
MTSRIAGHLLVDCLLAQGVSHVFGVPGESYLAVLDGFYAQRERIRFVICRQEGGAAFMAEAHGKLTGRPGVCFVTRGPGATNASIGVHTAAQDSTPMVLFVGDVASDQRDREAFQEVDYRAFFGAFGMAKRVERVDSPERLPEYVARAFATALNGRPGPVVLVLPEDMLTQPVPDALQPQPRWQVPAWLPDAGGLARLQALLQAAQRPIVIAGGSSWTPEGARELQAFAEAWQLPVATALRFQDSFDNHHRLYAGDVGIAINPRLAERIRQADLVLALGPRLGEMTTSGYTLLQVPRPQQRLIHVHPGAEELGRVYQPELALCASLPAMAAALAALPAPASVPWRDWTEAAHADYLANLQAQALPGPLDMAAVIGTLQRLLPPDAALCNGAGNFASWAHRFFRYHGLTKGVKTQLAPTNGAMGYGVPAAIACAITSGRVVVALTGDGDFMMTGQELATARQYGARLIVVLVNNGVYGTIRMHQARAYPQRQAGSMLTNPDFVRLAESHGLAGVRVERTEQFEPALRAALARSDSTLIEIMLSEQVITTRSTLEAIETQAAGR